MNNRTLLICATPAECRPLLPKKQHPRPLRIGGRWAYALSPQVLLLVCGVGKANCAQALTAAVERTRPEKSFSRVVSFGSAGAWPGSGLAVGDLAVATTEISDEGAVLPGRLAGLEEIGLPLQKNTQPPVYNHLPVDAGLSAAALDACRRVAPPFKALAGPFLTVSRVTSALAEAERLSRLFPKKILCENMEGAAAALVALHYGLAFCEIRAISNLVDDREQQSWDFALASQNCARAVAALLDAFFFQPGIQT
ncbi:MAG: futalosine hydrolase [Pseudomonadota bacterium]